MKIIILFILFLNFCFAVDLTVIATGFRNDQGLARIAVFSSAEGFPDRPTNNNYAGSTKIVNGQAQINFRNIPAGNYAISVLHDEDLDGKIKLGFLGIPQEGYGLSNQTKGIFGPPNFTEAKIDFKKQREKINISIFY